LCCEYEDKKREVVRFARIPSVRSVVKRVATMKKRSECVAEGSTPKQLPRFTEEWMNKPDGPVRELCKNETSREMVDQVVDSGGWGKKRPIVDPDAKSDVGTGFALFDAQK
jgi:hypothetical protein